MRLPEAARPGNSPRPPSRLTLYAPFVALLVAAVAWSGAWLWLRARTLSGLDAARAAWAAEGRRLDWKTRSLSGWPFRLDLDLTGASLADASGWAVSTPALHAEAPAYAPGHWVAVAPEGATLTRPNGGDVRIAAWVLRASLSEAEARPPRFSLEGLDLAFTPAPGARPFAVSAAGELHLHLRAGPDDQGAAYLALYNGRPAPGSLLGRIGRGAPVTLVFDVLYSHAGRLAGPDWRAAAEAWRRAGGTLRVRRLAIAAGAAGGATIEARGTGLGIGADGRLTGTLTAEVRGGRAVLAALAAAGRLRPEAAGAAGMVLGAASGRAGAVATTLTFQGGQATLGPAALGPSPKIY